MWEWFKRQLCGDTPMTVEERRQDRRSKVRVIVTYWAALYIFGGAAALIALVLWGKLKEADFHIVREIFTLGLPIATGVITYWFATRQQGQSEKEQPETPTSEKPEDPSAISRTDETPHTGEEEPQTEPERPNSQSQA